MGFEASAMAAAAEGSIGVDDVVADLPVATRSAIDQSSVHIDGRPYTIGDIQVEYVFGRQFGIGGDFGQKANPVAIESNGKLEMLGKHLTQRNIFPAERAR